MFENRDPISPANEFFPIPQTKNCLVSFRPLGAKALKLQACLKYLILWKMDKVKSIQKGSKT